ncbi:glycoside hydrolase family 6 protein [Geodermatophilus sp. SYSU D01036]
MHLRSPRATVRATRWKVAAPLAAATLAVSAAAYGTSSPEPAPSGTSLPELASSLYVDPDSQAAVWAQSHPDDPAAREVEERIASQPTGKWFGAWSGDITTAVEDYTSAAADAGEVPVLIAYNVPHRDCGGHSAGGQGDEGAYRRWVDGFDAGLGDRPALVVLEPDALAQLDTCLSDQQQEDRLRLLSYAVEKLQSDDVWVYLDAGHSNWVPADVMAERLEAAGIADAHGFALNVSNYNATDDEVAYADELNGALGTSKPFVVDTSRNGNGANGEWCNPGDRQIGEAPGAEDGGQLRLWLKAPGESDGDCGIGEGTAAGEFSPELAMSLLEGAEPVEP